jgi:hypothetical protein
MKVSGTEAIADHDDGEGIDVGCSCVACYVADAIDQLLADPRDDTLQRGYLAALVAVYREGVLGVAANVGHADEPDCVTEAAALLGLGFNRGH